jgi:hypothetical protein
MLKKILYTIIFIYIQTTHCIESNKENIIINNKKPAAIACDDCCYPIENEICILFYNFCKTETLKMRSFFILFNKQIKDAQAVSRIKKKDVDLLFVKNTKIYLKMVDHINLIRELNNNINILKKSNTPKSGYDLFLSFLNSKKNQPKVVKSRKNTFVNKLKFKTTFEQMKSYMRILSHAKNNTFIYIYNENHKDECKKNSTYNINPTIASINYQDTSSIVTLNLYPAITSSSKPNTDYQITTSQKIVMSKSIANHSNIYPTKSSINYQNTSSVVTLNLYPAITSSSKPNTDYQITTSQKIVMSKSIANHSNIYPTKSSINYQNTSSVVTLNLYPAITASSKPNTDYQITTSQKIIIPTATINNDFSSNYIASTANILLPKKSDTIYNSISIKSKNHINNTNFSNSSLKYLNLTNKNNKASIVYNYHYYETKIFLSIVIIFPVVCIVITSLIVYKFFIKSKKKHNTNESQSNSNNVKLSVIDDYHIYETAETDETVTTSIDNNTNNVIAVSYNQNNLEDSYNDRIYELPTDYYQCDPINSNITEQNNQNENMNMQLQLTSNAIIDESSCIENSNKLDNNKLQNDLIEHNYNILESEDDITEHNYNILESEDNTVNESLL